MLIKTFLSRILFCSLLLVPSLSLADLFNVTNDNNTGAGSLRQAILDVNSSSGPHEIIFAVSNSLTVISSLPQIQEQVMIDGRGVTIGASSGAWNIFYFNFPSSGNTVTGCALVDSNNAIVFNLSHCNRVTNCRLGTDWANASGRGNTMGIRIQRGHYNDIGGNSVAERNIISGNSSAGIYVIEQSTYPVEGTRIRGNFIGIASDGVTPLPNGTGVYFYDSLYGYIGGSRAANESNVISGNTNYGILLYNEDNYGNTICGNTIGLSADQSLEIPNTEGLTIQRSSGNIIGLPVIGYENVITGNTNFNVIIEDNSGSPRPRDNILMNNFVGVDSAGNSFTSSNNAYGLYLNGSDSNIIGGVRGSLQMNVFSGNNADVNSCGIYLDGNSNTIRGNHIGVSRNGLQARANYYGIRFGANTSGNIIGGSKTPAFYGNIISGNQSHGIMVQSGDQIIIKGNYIGTNRVGDTAIANGQAGIYLSSTTNMVAIGGSTPAEGNLVSGNGYNGIYLGCTNVTVQNNSFGFSAAGDATITNGNGCSIYMQDTDENLIRSNSFSQKIYMLGSDSTGNTIIANTFGVMPSDGSSVSGMDNGVMLLNGANGNFIGLPSGNGNLISNCIQNGIYLDGSTTINNACYGNTITSFNNEGIRLGNNANSDKAIPVITWAVNGTGIAGTSGANDYIEVFIAEAATGNGGSINYLGTTVADGSGNWFCNPGGFSTGDYVCAIATDSSSNSSEFSANIEVLATMPTSTPTITQSPTFTITSTSTPTATLTFTPSATSSITATPTPSNTQTFTVTLTATESPVFTFTTTPTMTLTSTPTSTITSTATISATVTMTSTAAPETATYTPTPTPTMTQTIQPIDMQGHIALPYPNPAKDKMRFMLDMKQNGKVSLEFYNLQGEQISKVNESLQSGTNQSIIWNCRNVAPGVYLVRVLIDGVQKETKKIAILSH